MKGEFMLEADTQRDKARTNNMLKTGLNVIIFIGLLFISATYFIYSHFNALLLQQGSDELAYQFGTIHYGFVGVIAVAIFWRICLVIRPLKCAVYKDIDTRR